MRLGYRSEAGSEWVTEVDPWAVVIPRAIGRLEPLDAETTRLVGSTSNPVWYAEQLAAIPAPYRIVRCTELQEAARVLGQRLFAAAPQSTRDVVPSV